MPIIIAGLIYYIRSLAFDSEQQLVSCSGPYGNYACNGGMFSGAWNYIIAAGGLENNTAYPYTSGAAGVVS